MARLKKVQNFPVMDGAQPAPREDQIAGIVERVWADSQLYHADVEPMLRQWLSATGCMITDAHFEVLLNKARGEFAHVATATSEDTEPHCPAHSLVSCLYWDVQTLERANATGSVE